MMNVVELIGPAKSESGEVINPCTIFGNAPTPTRDFFGPVHLEAPSPSHPPQWRPPTHAERAREPFQEYQGLHPR